MFDNREKLKVWAFLAPGGNNFDLIEKIDRNSFVIIFDELSNDYFRFSLRPIGSKIDVFFSNTIPNLPQ